MLVAFPVMKNRVSLAELCSYYKSHNNKQMYEKNCFNDEVLFGLYVSRCIERYCR